MSIIPQDYFERCYAGWLAKLIGIRYGAPIEGWSYEHIKEAYGELDGYVVNYNMFAADDDSNGPMIFIRALNDYTCTRDITAQQIGEGWLNYAPYEHGFYWWGGYGMSTEHTAYLNLRSGIPAPRSGSIQQNGSTVAEQIGGQIFIDTWGLVLPNRPELAAEYAGKAASVSHGGNGIYGGQFVAAMISLAFTAKSVRSIIEGALKVIPEDCEYTRAVKAVMKYYDEQKVKDWREAFLYVKENWGYAKYPGNCHIIPNSAVMILALLYGEENFDRTLNICNMCGWDTDCNVGNVATVMGVFCGLDGIDYKKWRLNVNDTFMVSSVLGCLNVMDVPWCAAYLADLAYRMAGEEIPAKWKLYIKPEEQYYHFRLPDTTHGFKAVCDMQTECVNVGGKLKVSTKQPAAELRAAKKTYFMPKDFHDSRYDPAMAPGLYPGMRIEAKAEAAEGITACLYVHDRNRDEYFEGETVSLGGGMTALSMDVPALEHALIDEMGVKFLPKDGEEERIEACITDVRFTGKPDYDIDFPYEHTEIYTGTHRPVSQFTFLKGIWALENGRMAGSVSDYGETYTGDIRWTDYSFEGSMECSCEGEVGLNVRVQGAIRSYCVAMRNGKLMIKKNANGYTTLAECDHETELGKSYRFRIEAVGSRISVYENGSLVLETVDNDKPYLNGCIGCSLRNGARAYFDHFVIRSK